VFNPNYDSNIQKWGVPIASQVRDKMLHCFEHKIRSGFAETVDFIKQEFSLEAVGKKFVTSLKGSIQSSQVLLPNSTPSDLSAEAGSDFPENVTGKKNEKIFILSKNFRNIFREKILLDEKGLSSVSFVFE
jgi:hypothetical protein